LRVADAYLVGAERIAVEENADPRCGRERVSVRGTMDRERVARPASASAVHDGLRVFGDPANHQDRDGDVSLDHGREAMLSIEERSVVGELDRLAGQLPSPGRHVTGVLAYLRRSDVPVAGVGLQPQAGRLR